MPPEDEFERLVAETLALRRNVDDDRRLAMVKRAFLSQHCQQLTEAQSVAIPSVIHGDNVLLVAPTASGKTEAALIPIATCLVAEGSQGLCIYVAPTRALLNDIMARVGPPLERLHLRYAVRHGDSPLPKRVDELAFLFTTPESLDFLLRAAPSLLRRTSWAVLDEIHQLYGPPRGDQLRILLRRLEVLSGGRIQVVAMSATVAEPEQLASWLFRGRKARLHRVPATRELDVSVHLGPVEAGLRSLLSPQVAQKVLVFANSRRQCEELHRAADKAEPYASYVHYSSLSRAERLAVERGFARDAFAVCFTTSTLELGVDIGSVDLVALADPPTSVESFLQRSGRASRREKAIRVACLADSLVSLLVMLSAASLAIEGRLERAAPGSALGVTVQQVLSYISSKARHRFHPSELEKPLLEPGELSVKDLDTVLQSLVSRKLLEFDSSWNSYVVGPALAPIIDLPAVHSNIAEASDGLPVYHGNRRIGTVALSYHELREGRVMVFAGRHWRVIGVGEGQVRVVPSPSVDSPLMPRWDSRGRVPIGRLIAERCSEILCGRESVALPSMDSASEMALQRLRGTVGELCESKCLPFWSTSRYVESLTFAGEVCNVILALAFREAGVDCRPAKRREFIALQSDRPLDARTVPSDLGQVVALIDRHWRALSPYIYRSPFSATLPARLRRAETLAQVTSPDALDFIAGFHTKKAVRAVDPWGPQIHSE